MGRPTPRVFHYSLDWRFLLPIADPGNFLVIFDEDADFSQTLEQAGIPLSNHLAFSNIKKKAEQSNYSFILPFGLPVEKVGAKPADPIEFFCAMRSLMDSDGYLLFGFNNAWGFLSKPSTNYYSSTLRKVTNQLQHAGFKTIKIFGAIPNLSIPEYIFDLNADTIHFAVQHRFGRRPAVWHVLRIWSHLAGWTSISRFLPCYFVVAAGERS